MERMNTQSKVQQLKQRFDWLQQFSDEELRDISFCEEGASLNPEMEYFDISHPEKGVIRPSKSEMVPEGCCYVAREDVRDSAWRKLTSFGGK